MLLYIAQAAWWWASPELRHSPHLNASPYRIRLQPQMRQRYTRPFFCRQVEGVRYGLIAGDIWQAASAADKKEIHPATRVNRRKQRLTSASHSDQIKSTHFCQDINAILGFGWFNVIARRTTSILLASYLSAGLRQSQPLLQDPGQWLADYCCCRCRVCHPQFTYTKHVTPFFASSRV